MPSVFSTQQLPLGDLRLIAETVDQKPGLRGTTVNVLTIHRPDGATLRTLRVSTDVDSATLLDEQKLSALDAEIKRDMVRLYPNVQEIDQLAVTFQAGYNIGIWSFNTNRTLPGTRPQEISLDPGTPGAGR